jgi:hypothetical protein
MLVRACNYAGRCGMTAGAKRYCIHSNRCQEVEDRAEQMVGLVSANEQLRSKHRDIVRPSHVSPERPCPQSGRHAFAVLVDRDRSEVHP